MKGYKLTDFHRRPAFYKDNGLVYAEGECYKVTYGPLAGYRGFHYCKHVSDLYENMWRCAFDRIFEVKASGAIHQDDEIYATSHIRFIHELTPDEILDQLVKEYEAIKHKDESGVLLGFIKALYDSAVSGEQYSYMRVPLLTDQDTDARRRAWLDAYRKRTDIVHKVVPEVGELK